MSKYRNTIFYDFKSRFFISSWQSWKYHFPTIFFPKFWNTVLKIFISHPPANTMPTHLTPPPLPPPPLHTHTHTPPLPINESSWHKLFHSCFSVKSFWEVPYSEIMSSTQSPFIVVATMVAIMSKMWRTVHIMIYNILKVYHWVIMCLVLQNLNFHTWVFQTFIICPYVVKWYSS